LTFMAHVGPTATEFAYEPRSDFMFLSNHCPMIMVEVCSNRSESDRFRMLLQCGLLVRAINSLKRTESVSFVAVAIYITTHLIAERYLVYQPSKSEPDVRITDSSILNDRGSFLL